MSLSQALVVLNMCVCVCVREKAHRELKERKGTALQGEIPLFSHSTHPQMALEQKQLRVQRL